MARSCELGFLNVFQADNGKTAQDLMRKQQIDIVVGHWGMPVMSGIDLLKWMRGDHRYASTRFMMLTAEANPESVRTALQAGVNAYMIKPFTVHSFACKFMSMLGVTLETAASLPFARVAAPAPKPAAAPVPAPAASALPESNVIGLEPPIGERVKKSTVLIVDDIPTNIEVPAGVLKDEYAIKVAISGKKALEIADAFHIDLILLDIMMPVMDGFETCRRVKANRKTAHIPIFFLSARDDTEDVRSLRRARSSRATCPLMRLSMETRRASFASVSMPIPYGGSWHSAGGTALWLGSAGTSI